MDTKLRKGVDVPDYDEKVLRALNSKARKDSGNVMVIGIRNPAGNIYRIVKTKGLSEFIGIVGELQRLDLTDELADIHQMVKGCDAIFRP